jgi:endonuclease-8
VDRTIRTARSSRRHGLDARAFIERTPLAVEARGKHLLIELDDRRFLHSHLGMTGSWHVYRPGERWRKPGRNADLVLENDGWQVICFTPPVLALLTERAVARHRVLSALGPDLLSPRFDARAAAARFLADPQRPLGEALLDQRLACGIGNVYKSEGLFTAGLDPFGPVAQLDRAGMASLLEAIQTEMLRNMDGYPRTTRRSTDGGRAWVYGRVGQPCHRCGTTIRMRRQGDAGRSTYFCPRCQSVAGA